MEEITKETLGAKTLSTLRSIGWKIGVKSTTSRRKSELIEEILNILRGITKPCFSRRGRPKKDSNVIEISNENIENSKKERKESLLEKIEKLINTKIEELKKEIIELIKKHDS